VPAPGRADFYAPRTAPVVDEPSLRAAAGFDTQLSSSDVERSLRNILERGLDNQQYHCEPIVVTVAVLSGAAQLLRAA
jgi:hypothetical protein